MTEAVRLTNALTETGRFTRLYVTEGQNTMIDLTFGWRSCSEERYLRYYTVKIGKYGADFQMNVLFPLSR